MKIEEYLESKDIEYKGPNRRGFVQIDCPFCDGTKKMNIYVEDSDYEQGFFNCWTCPSKKVDFNYLKAKIENKPYSSFKSGPNKRKEELFDFSISIINDVDNNKTSVLDNLRNYPLIDMPFGSRLIQSEDSSAVDYLQKRGLSLSDSQDLGIHVMPFQDKDTFVQWYKSQELDEAQMWKHFKESGKYIDRVIIPLKVLNKTYGFIARDYSGERDPAFKVLNSEGPLTSGFVWNFDNVKQSKTIVINEGIFDSVKCRLDRSVSLLGKAITDHSDKLMLLTLLRPEEFILYPDAGAFEDAKKMAEILIRHTESRVRIVAKRPILNRSLTEEEFKFLSYFINVESDNGEYSCAPFQLKLVHDIFRVFSKASEKKMSIKTSLGKLEHFERYKNNKKLLKKVKKFVWKINGSKNKSQILSRLESLKSLDFEDAGDLTVEENDKLIENAIDYHPHLKFEDLF